MSRAPDGVYALRYATRDASVRGEHFYGLPDDCMGPWPIHYYTWAVLQGGSTVVFDAGFTPAEAERRGNREYVATPLELLAGLGVAPDEVQHLALSHLHYDHTGYAESFPSATVHVQREELDFWRSPMGARGAYAHLLNRDDLEALGRLEAAGRLRTAVDDVQLTDRISLHLVGGHTAGTQVMRVETEDGPVVLASDASHFYANIEADHPYGVVHELPRMYRAFDRLYALAGSEGVVVPGHDPRVADRHVVLPGTENAIIRLRPLKNEETE